MRWGHRRYNRYQEMLEMRRRRKRKVASKPPSKKATQTAKATVTTFINNNNAMRVGAIKSFIQSTVNTSKGSTTMVTTFRNLATAKKNTESVLDKIGDLTLSQLEEERRK